MDFSQTQTRADVLIALARKYRMRKGVEVGVADGGTSFKIMSTYRPMQMTGVDHFPDAAGGETYRDQPIKRRRAMRRFATHDSKLLVETSEQAAKQFEDKSLDLVFIDAAHDEASVRQDIELWRPKLRHGGWLVGHDASMDGVAAAIADLSHERAPHDLWLHQVFHPSSLPMSTDKRVALVLGGAACVGDDAEMAIAFCKDKGLKWGAVACNEIAADYTGDLDAIVTVHSNKLGKITATRHRKGLNRAPTYAHNGRPTVLTDWAFPGQRSAGSSGLFAAKVALVDLGFDAAILCGIPMDNSPHYFDDKPWTDADHHWPAFLEVADSVKGRLVSMSGRTRDLLGGPEALL